MGVDALGGFSSNIPAQIAVLGAALSYGISGVVGRRFARMGLAPMTVAAGQLCASSVMMAPLMLLIDQPWLLAMPSAKAMLAGNLSLRLASGKIVLIST